MSGGETPSYIAMVGCVAIHQVVTEHTFYVIGVCVCIFLSLDSRFLLVNFSSISPVSIISLSL